MQKPDGGILSETKILLADGDDSASIQDNFNRFRQSNILGKASRSRVDDILKAFRLRYLNEVQVTEVPICLIRAKLSANSLDQSRHRHGPVPAGGLRRSGPGPLPYQCGRAAERPHRQRWRGHPGRRPRGRPGPQGVECLGDCSRGVRGLGGRDRRLGRRQSRVTAAPLPGARLLEATPATVSQASCLLAAPVACQELSVYVFHERATSDTLPLILGTRYVSGKINQLKNHMDEVRTEMKTAEGRAKKLLEKDLEDLETKLLGLEAFEAAIRHVLEQKNERGETVGWAPEIDDGVILNQAPLRELMPSWKEPEKFWQELEEGKYDWSYMAMRYWPDRVGEKCKTNKSYVIAHGLMDMYGEE